jgi:methyl-CpG-binding domain protein 4
MIPPRSGYGLIQEDLWPDSWKIFVSCVMLNCTTRKQVEKILPKFFSLWPRAEELLKSNPEDIAETIATLGFKNRRTKNLLSMSRLYLEREWKDPRELPGIGEYGARAWEIFCADKLGDEPPKDGALVLYWEWRKKHDNRT